MWNEFKRELEETDNIAEVTDILQRISEYTEQLNVYEEDACAFRDFRCWLDDYICTKASSEIRNYIYNHIPFDDIDSDFSILTYSSDLLRKAQEQVELHNIIADSIEPSLFEQFSDVAMKIVKYWNYVSISCYDSDNRLVSRFDKTSVVKPQLIKYTYCSIFNTLYKVYREDGFLVFSVAQQVTSELNENRLKASWNDDDFQWEYTKEDIEECLTMERNEDTPLVSFAYKFCNQNMTRLEELNERILEQEPMINCGCYKYNFNKDYMYFLDVAFSDN